MERWVGVEHPEMWRCDLPKLLPQAYPSPAPQHDAAAPNYTGNVPHEIDVRLRLIRLMDIDAATYLQAILESCWHRRTIGKDPVP
jgi:hypothetical protein